jgi:uncharacterized membrane protein YkoI
MIFLLAVALPGSAPSQQQGQAARMGTALTRGEVLPLSRILTIARGRVPGEMLEVRLEEQHKRRFYIIEILTPSGRIQEVRLNAQNGCVLAVENE